MTTEEVAARFNALAKEGKWFDIQAELFADHAVSIEPAHAAGFQSAEGKEAIKAKGEAFAGMIEETHGGYASEPLVGGNHFSISMGMDVTMKGGQRSKLDEIALYEVQDGKIVKEQFFY
jgi:hypothetical protein